MLLVLHIVPQQAACQPFDEMLGDKAKAKDSTKMEKKMSMEGI